MAEYQFVYYPITTHALVHSLLLILYHVWMLIILSFIVKNHAAPMG